MARIKKKITVTVEPDLLDHVDRYVASQKVDAGVNRSTVFKDALKLWWQSQIDKQIEEFYRNRSKADAEEEAWWGEFGAEQLAKVWDDL